MRQSQRPLLLNYENRSQKLWEVCADSQSCLPELFIFSLCEACPQKHWIVWCSSFLYFLFVLKVMPIESQEQILILIGIKDGLVSLKRSLRDSLTPKSNSLHFLVQGIRRFNVPTAVIGSPFIRCQPGNWSRLKESALPCSRACWAVSWQMSDHT